MNENDLQWTAFRYIAGELSHADAEAFEARLADDQAAREAVAASVQMTQAVASISDEITAGDETADEQRRKNRWAIVAIVVSAACLLMASSILFTQPDSQTGLSQSDARADQIVDAWANAAETIPPSVDSVANGLEESVDDESEVVVPEWMLAAVSEDLGTDSETNDKTWEN